MSVQTISERRCFGGTQGVYSHASEQCGGEMRFAVFVPPGPDGQRWPVLYWLSGLECSEANFIDKAGAQRVAAELGLIIVAADTSPRGAKIPGEEDDWDFGTGAGFYLDATQPPWVEHYRMYSYVTEELPGLVDSAFPTRGPGACGISGHSMGGHGALVIGLRNPASYRSVSAFAPICAPSRCPWGDKAFTGYLGEDRAAWQQYDASELAAQHQHPRSILIDQGGSDPFLETQLMPGLLQAAFEASGQPFSLRTQPGYDHSYYFVASFIEDHLRFHARHLK
jgi:S-formylglutathione hydrolase